MGRYNLRATGEQFVARDQVQCLRKEVNVKMEEFMQGHLANKLRSYHTQVSAVGVIFEDCREFGGVPLPSYRTPAKAGVMLNIRECRFVNSQVRLVLARHGVDPEKARAIKGISASEIKQHLQSFIGLVSFYRD